LYVTPHRWTQFFEDSDERQVIQTDKRKWDYKHQVLATRHMPAWVVLLWVKFIEAVMQLRPQSLKRVLTHHDLPIRDAMKWYYRIGRQVWPYEIWRFFLRDKPKNNGITLANFWAGQKVVDENRKHFRINKISNEYLEVNSHATSAKSSNPGASA
jgi:anaerobic magnesium-protoporphyrin IX monomethyl ester cyclase